MLIRNRDAVQQAIKEKIEDWVDTLSDDNLDILSADIIDIIEEMV